MIEHGFVARSSEYPAEWIKYGLSIAPGIYGEKFDTAKKCHWMVVKYLDSHPLEITQLFNEKGEIKYFDVLNRAEFATL
jgi:hypothetical protein